MTNKELKDLLKTIKFYDVKISQDISKIYAGQSISNKNDDITNYDKEKLKSILNNYKNIMNEIEKIGEQ